MKCRKCGSKNAGAMKFCTNCGAPLGEPTIPMDRVPHTHGKPPSTAEEPTRAFAQPPAPPAPPAAPPAAKAGMKKATKVIIAVVVALLVLGGAAAGIIIWKVVESNKLIAEIEEVDLSRADADGRSLDLKDVPLDEDLSFEVTYLARFKKGGKGTLDVTIVDGSDEQVWSDSYKLESSDDPRTHEFTFAMLISEGETFKATAVLEISNGDEKAEDSRTLEFYVKEGKGEEATLQEARDAAAAKIEEAKGVVAETGAAGIDTSDLAQQLSTIESDLQSATTEDEVQKVYATAEAIVNECNARKAAAADQAARERDIAACRRVMYDYAYAEKGNCEDVWWVNFSMNNERTSATGKLEGLVTVHTDPDRAGQRTYFFLTAEKRGGQWVVVDYSYEHILSTTPP
ncbi:MAG: hypothetical protein KKH73_03105 [Actinobacteria bacterium]|nr:hypothetical protein [Actinomycetota bacterium]